MNKRKVMILSGGFDPLHSGHIEMMQAAKKMAHVLVICLNSDKWLTKKKGINFLPIDERLKIINSISCVDDVIAFADDEYGSAINGIKAVIEKYKNYFRAFSYPSDGGEPSDEFEEPIFIFGNGGDRNPKSTPTHEQKFCEENGIEMVWGLGGDKSNSSSWILNRYRDWHFEMTDRVWGNYKVVYQDSNKKVKIIEIMPHSCISLQTHSQRSEHWVVVEGTANVLIETEKFKHEETVERNESIFVPVGAKHKLCNNKDSLLQIVDVQIGDYLGEDDIQRYD
jgi:cytidyltransferase-like protein